MSACIDELSFRILAIEEQRNAALTQAAIAEARLALANRTISSLSKQLEEVKNKAVQPQGAQDGGDNR